MSFNKGNDTFSKMAKNIYVIPMMQNNLNNKSEAIMKAIKLKVFMTYIWILHGDIMSKCILV